MRSKKEDRRILDKLPEPLELKQRYGLVIKQLQQTFADRLKTVVLFGSQARLVAHLSNKGRA